MLNTIASVLHQTVTLLCNLILPRLIIYHYGSATNGLLSSITQFLALFPVAEMGVGVVVLSSLYKPLAAHDEAAVSRILISSRRFFSRLGLLFCFYSAVLMAYFALAVDHRHGYAATAVLVAAAAAGSVANYFFGIIYSQLLEADQRSYVRLWAATLVTVANTALVVFLIRADASIEAVKLASAAVLLANPLVLRLYVLRHYRLDLTLPLTEEPLKQKWNAFAHQIALYVFARTDVLILTWFSTLENVSIYYVYHHVAAGVLGVVSMLTPGVQPLLGSLYARGETAKLDQVFSAYEMMLHALVTFLYTSAGILAVPFVRVYTRGVSDANYAVPAFAAVFVAANAVHCLSFPYSSMIGAAGRFKETQGGAIMEAALNIVVSLALFFPFGLAGVALGTLAAAAYMTVYLARYLRSHVLRRPLRKFWGHIFVDVAAAFITIFIASLFRPEAASWSGWLRSAAKVSAAAGAVTVGLNVLCYRALLRDSLRLWRGKHLE